MFKTKLIWISKLCLPYILILLACFVSNYFIFFDGIAAGDDIRFHLYQIQDLLYGFDNGYFGLSTNHQYMGGFALNNYGFYGPFPHYAAAIIAYLTRWPGGDAIFGLKAVYLITTFIGGIYVYKLAKKMSKNTAIALISAVMFVYMPYRIFCAVCRVAFAEAVAICFIPLIFYGAYSIIHDEKYYVGPYIALVIGSAIVISSHPFTGLMCAIFGIIYLLINIKTIIHKRKDAMMWVSMGVSALLILCLTGFYLGNAITVKMTDIYRLNDSVIDWTTYDHVASQTAVSVQFSGFLNFIWISGQTSWSETVSSLVFGIFVFLISVVNAVAADSLVKLAPKNKYYRWAVSAVAAFIFPPIFLARLEIYLSVATFVLIYIAFSYIFDREKPVENSENKPLKFNLDFYFLITVIFICLILIFVASAWKPLPAIFYQCQFPWRLWGICMFFAVMLITLLLSYVKKYKTTIASFLILTASLLTLSQGLLEKRIHVEKGLKMYKSEDISLVNNYDAMYSGAQNEMVPLVLMDLNYESEYENSLHSKIRNALLYRTSKSFIYSLEDYEKYNPVFLEGNGNIKIVEYNSPNNTFVVEVKSDSALVQFPQIYNYTYEAFADGRSVGEAKNVDGLIAFELPKGKYTLNVEFLNSKGYRIARPFLYAGIIATISFGIFGLYYRYKNESKQKEES